MASTAKQNWNWSTVLVTGGAGGLGRGIAELFLKRGKKVIIAGRTESKLQATCKEVPGLEYLVLDVANVASIKPFVQNLLAKYPNLDAVVANAGIQKPIRYWAKDGKSINPEEVINAADAEIDTNIRGTTHLIAHLLPHLQSRSPKAAIMTVSSGLAFVPIHQVPVYCATKAFIRSWTMSLRVQIGNDVRVLEIIPPLVESDLHRDHDNWEAHKDKNPIPALTLQQFITDVERDMDAGRDDITPGFAQGLAQAWDGTFGARFKGMNAVRTDGL
ncbi:short-chain dehydrogenase [Phlyctochytrium arcticum]|nr:short-chain dehydrogenase [Phlyctochytrium arcticum]